MKIFQHLIITIGLIALSACTIVDGGAIVTGITRAPILTDEVRIYRVPPKKYEEIAMLSSSAGHDFLSDSALVNSAITTLKKEAAKLGANGVLLNSINERDATNTTTSYGVAQAYGNNGSSVYATGNGISVNRGDAYTRIKGLAIYVP